MPDSHILQEFYRIFMQESRDGYWYARLTQPLAIHLPLDEQVDHLYKHAVIADCNAAFAAMYGYSNVAELLTTPLLAFVTREESKNRETLEAFIASKYVLRDAITHETDRHGNPRWFNSYAHGEVEEGHLVGIWGYQRDITRERQREFDRMAFLQKLSARQKVILQLLMDNYSLKETARILNITYSTAHTHCQRMRKHFKVSDITALVHHARQIGITGSSAPDTTAPSVPLTRKKPRR
jgi:DNA-binding CsgD family transcriptional regulator